MYVFIMYNVYIVEWRGGVLSLVLVGSLMLSTLYPEPRNWMGEISVNGSKKVRFLWLPNKEN